MVVDIKIGYVICFLIGLGYRGMFREKVSLFSCIYSYIR